MSMTASGARVCFLFALVALIAVPSMGVAWDDCRHSAQRETVINTDGATEVHLQVRAGSLRVVGVSGRTEVRAEGKACAKKESDLDEIELRSRLSGKRVVIETLMPDGGNTSLDLTVEMPAQLLLTIDDSSGPITVAGVAGADIEDSSGEIEVSNIAGDLSIDDSSGEIEVRRVTGSVRLRDSSGDIRIRDVDGDVVIEEDSSGDITVTDVGGGLQIEEDSSGDIRAERITGDFVVDRDGSGDIDYDEIGGQVDLPRR